MRLLLIFTLLFATIVSCQKEPILTESTPVDPEVSELNETESLFFFDNDSVIGTIKLFCGETLIRTLNFDQDELLDTTLFAFSTTLYYIRLTEIISDSDLLIAEGWCHVNIELEKATAFIMNVNYCNGQMTFFNNDPGFPEPSTKMAFDTDELFNTFWINYLDLPENTSHQE